MIWTKIYYWCRAEHTRTHTHTHTRLTALFPGLPGWAGTRKEKHNLDFTEARDSEWQWHQLGHMQVCTLLQSDNHTSTPPLCFYRPDALPATQPTASKHCRAEIIYYLHASCYLLFTVLLAAGERYNVNIGEVDDVECGMKRNIIHLLCLHPMSHSELVKLLPEDVCQSSAFFIHIADLKFLAVFHHLACKVKSVTLPQWRLTQLATMLRFLDVHACNPHLHVIF